MDSRAADPLMRKVAWRLVPLLCLLYIFNIIDRANVGFARLEMENDLGISKRVYDFGIGIFYFGYLVFEVPANLIMVRVGARRWIARIMISWGLVSCATMFVKGPIGFYIVRIMLGVAEAGFFPGIILYLTYWFPTRDRAGMMAWFMVAIAGASVIGNPISGAIMQYMNGVAGLRGWQWLFLLEGLPSVVLGVAVLSLLPDGPKQAGWLSEEERSRILDQVQQEDQSRRLRHGMPSLRSLLEWRVALLTVVYFTVALGLNASGAHFPRLIQIQFPERGTFSIGLLAALPHVCAIIGMTLFAAHSDRTGERKGHVAFAACLGAAGWFLADNVSDPWLYLVGLCVAQTGMMCVMPTFWTLPTSFLSGTVAAGGIALINSLGNIGGLVAPNILSEFGLGAIGATLIAGGALVLLVRHDAPAR